jgi:hypothetical protein
LLAACVLAIGSGACGRIGYDVLTAIGGVGGTGGSTSGAGGNGNRDGSGDRKGDGGDGDGDGNADGDKASGGMGGGGVGGTGGVAVVDGGPCVDGGPPCGGVRLQYHPLDNNKPDDVWIKPHFNLINETGAAIPLSELVIRYWYTIDSAGTQMMACDSAGFGCPNLTGNFFTGFPPRADADSYILIGFLAGAGTLAAGGQTQEFGLRFDKTNFSNFDETNDYSYDGSLTVLTDYTRVTLYRNGALIWGVEP